jgi:3-oxoacyl-[acyl-carrier protein] reductase
MDLGLKDKVALVLAAAGGLGGRIAQTLAGEGARVCLSDIDAAALQSTVAAIAERGGHVKGFPGDLAETAALSDLVNQVETTVGPIDVLVNITGGPPASLTAGVAPEVWEKHFRAMVLSVTQLTNLVLPGMRQRKWGRIITSTSSGVIAPIPDLGLSNALRSTLVGWSKTLSREVAPDGVTVNIVVPGRIATARIRQLDEMRAKRENKPLADIVAASTSTIPMRRYGEPQEYADAVTFLASERASYITGTMIRIDGGLIGSI